MNTEKTSITVQAIIDAPLDVVWKNWTTLSNIVKWNFALDSWHSPRAENDLRSGGSFLSRMEAKDGSAGFDFGGTYTKVVTYKVIKYTIGDGRKVRIKFTPKDGRTKVVETFEAEKLNPVEMQHSSWQAILDNFKKYTEANN